MAPPTARVKRLVKKLAYRWLSICQDRGLVSREHGKHAGLAGDKGPALSKITTQLTGIDAAIQQYIEESGKDIHRDEILRTILDKGADARSRVDLNFLAEIVRDVKFFAKLKPHVREMLLRIMKYEKIGRRGLVFMQDDPGDKFYIIFQGAVDIFIRQDVSEVADVAKREAEEKKTRAAEEGKGDGKPGESDAKGDTGDDAASNAGSEASTVTDRNLDYDVEGHLKVAQLKNGMAFGELALINDAPRAASIVCSDTTEFIVIERDDYSRILLALHKEKMEKKQAFLHRQFFLSRLSNRLLSSFSYHFFATKLPKNHVLIRQGDVVENIFYLRSGECRILHQDEATGAVLDIAVVTENDAVGELAWLNKSRQRFTVVANTPVKAFLVPKSDFDKRCTRTMCTMMRQTAEQRESWWMSRVERMLQLQQSGAVTYRTSDKAVTSTPINEFHKRRVGAESNDIDVVAEEAIALGAGRASQFAASTHRVRPLSASSTRSPGASTPPRPRPLSARSTQSPTTLQPQSPTPRSRPLSASSYRSPKPYEKPPPRPQSALSTLSALSSPSRPSSARSARSPGAATPSGSPSRPLSARSFRSPSPSGSPSRPLSARSFRSPSPSGSPSRPLSARSFRSPSPGRPRSARSDRSSPRFRSSPMRTPSPDLPRPVTGRITLNLSSVVTPQFQPSTRKVGRKDAPQQRIVLNPKGEQTLMYPAKKAPPTRRQVRRRESTSSQASSQASTATASRRDSRSTDGSELPTVTPRGLRAIPPAAPPRPTSAAASFTPSPRSYSAASRGFTSKDPMAQFIGNRIMTANASAPRTSSTDSVKEALSRRWTDLNETERQERKERDWNRRIHALLDRAQRAGAANDARFQELVEQAKDTQRYDPLILRRAREALADKIRERQQHPPPVLPERRRAVRPTIVDKMGIPMREPAAPTSLLERPEDTPIAAELIAKSVSDTQADAEFAVRRLIDPQNYDPSYEEICKSRAVSRLARRFRREAPAVAFGSRQPDPVTFNSLRHQTGMTIAQRRHAELARQQPREPARPRTADHSLYNARNDSMYQSRFAKYANRVTIDDLDMPSPLVPEPPIAKIDPAPVERALREARMTVQKQNGKFRRTWLPVSL